MSIIKIAIVGGRDFINYDMLCDKMDWVRSNLKKRDSSVTIETLDGGAMGADELGKKWAEANGLKVHHHPADWKKHGNSAGPIRNREMAQEADIVVAFWDEQSPGTGHMIKTSKELGKMVIVQKYDILTNKYKYLLTDADLIKAKKEYLASKLKFLK